METIEELFYTLNKGVRFTLRKSLETDVKLWKEGVYRYFTPTCNLSCDGEFIHWQHGGSSANQNTLEDLRWTLDEIFDGATPEDFVALDYYTMLDVMDGEFGEIR